MFLHLLNVLNKEYHQVTKASSFTGFWDASVAAMVQHHTAALTVPVKLAGVVP